MTQGECSLAGSCCWQQWREVKLGLSPPRSFTVCHVRKPSNQQADPWHHLVVLMQDLHAVHSEELVLLGQAVQQQHCVPQTPHCPLLLVSPRERPRPLHRQPLSVQHHGECSDHLHVALTAGASNWGGGALDTKLSQEPHGLLFQLKPLCLRGCFVRP